MPTPSSLYLEHCPEGCFGSTRLNLECRRRVESRRRRSPSWRLKPAGRIILAASKSRACARGSIARSGPELLKAGGASRPTNSCAIRSGTSKRIPDPRHGPDSRSWIWVPIQLPYPPFARLIRSLPKCMAIWQTASTRNTDGAAPSSLNLPHAAEPSPGTSSLPRSSASGPEHDRRGGLDFL